jgi:hypothetical protein
MIFDEKGVPVPPPPRPEFKCEKCGGIWLVIDRPDNPQAGDRYDGHCAQCGTACSGVLVMIQRPAAAE